ncbi:hypothetical protein ACISU4_28765, partial [Streptomyces wuyuanensis]|uniref:hypothetical protein n=1 Tax=Streptomyces wuyuanensis TaxID=1196353 RepID=UPI0037F4D370
MGTAADGQRALRPAERPDLRLLALGAGPYLRLLTSGAGPRAGGASPSGRRAAVLDRNVRRRRELVSDRPEIRKFVTDFMAEAT